MESIKRIFKRLTIQSCPEVRLDALESSPFRKLSLELIFLIAGNLPLESVASLSLSCLPLYSCFKTEYLKSLKEAEYSVMNGFLHLLERDLPTHIVCPECNKLHFMPLAKLHLKSKLHQPPRENELKCRVEDSTGHFLGGTPAAFSTTIFRMAMKAYRQGDDTTALLGLLLYRRIYTHPGYMDVELCKAEARICDGSLIVRDQKVFLVPTSQRIPLTLHRSFGACRHIYFADMSHLYWYGIQVPQADEIDGYENKQGIISCQYCHIEFRVDFKSYGKAGNAVFFTRWIDFGEGRDANDSKRRRMKQSLDYSDAWTTVAYQRGSIYAAFEGKSEFKFDSLLTQKDERDLCRKLPWPPWQWPDYSAEVLRGGYLIGCVVRNGRLDYIHHQTRTPPVQLKEFVHSPSYCVNCAIQIPGGFLISFSPSLFCIYLLSER